MKETFPHGPVLCLGKVSETVDIECVCRKLIRHVLENVVDHTETIVGKNALGVLWAIGKGVVNLDVTSSREFGNVTGQRAECVLQVVVEKAKSRFAGPLLPSQVRFRVQATKHVDEEFESGAVEENVVDTRLVQAAFAVAV